MSAKKAASKNKVVNFYLKELRLVTHALTIPTHIKSLKPEDLSYKLNVELILDERQSTVAVLVKFVFMLNEMILQSLDVENTFVLADFKGLMKDGEKAFEQFGNTIVYSSVCHARGIHSQLILKTPLEGFYIPPVSRRGKFATIEKS